MTNKEKYQQERESQKRSREKANDKRRRMNANLEALQAANRAKAYIVPKGSELSPQIADKTVILKKPLYAPTYKI